MGLYDVQQTPPQAQGLRGLLHDRPQLPYLIPFVVFVGVTIPASFGEAFGVDWSALWMRYHPLVYTVKTVLAAALLWALWRYYTPIRWSHLGLGVVVGLFGVVLWVGVEWLSQQAGLTRNLMAGFDPGNPQHPASAAVVAKVYIPTLRLEDPTWRYLFYFIRIAGPTLVVPVMEELFFRDFIQRMLVRGVRFQDVAVGAFTWFSLIGMSVLFAINHIQWPSGFFYGLMMGILVVRTRSLGCCIVAHGVTNLVLYLFCVYQAEYLNNPWYWQFM